MKTKAIAMLLTATLLSMALIAMPVSATATKTVTPLFEDHEGEESLFDPAFVEFSTAFTILGDNSVKMDIPDGAIPDDGWGLGLNVEVKMAGVSTGLGLSRYDGISFKVYFESPAFDPDPTEHAPLYVSLILYDKTNNVWVSMIPTSVPWPYGGGWGSASMVFSGPDSAGWRTATPDPSGLWIAWSFAGGGWPGLTNWYDEVMTLSDWDAYIAANNLNVKVQKVNIQFGYRPPGVYQDWDGDGIPEYHSLGTSWGTVYVDQLKTHGFILDFEPAA